MNAYGDKTGPYFTLYASYTIEGSQRESLKASASNVTQDENGTTVRFKGVNGDLQVPAERRRCGYAEQFRW